MAAPGDSSPVQAGDPWLLDPGWRLALTLGERQILLRDQAAGAGSHIDSLAAERFADLTATAPLSDAGERARRLALRNLDDRSFRRLLGATGAEARHSLQAAPWLADLAEAFGGRALEPAAPAPARRSADRPIATLDGWCEPLVRLGLRWIREGLAQGRREGQPVATWPDLERLVAPALRWQLKRLAVPTLVLELHVSRLQDELQGETPEERFQSFCHSLSRLERTRSVLGEYPVLARLLATVTRQLANSTAEMLTRAISDRELLTGHFGPHRHPGRLTEITLGLGDRHDGGRSVSFLSFESGLSVVYKPRPLAVDAHFQQFVAWLAERGFEPPLQILRVLDRGDYGWTERVDRRDCNTKDQVKRFYVRLGGYLALVYLLGGTDFHLENIIACGEHPVLVDLETALHPRPLLRDQTINDIQARALLDSVMSTGLLPQRYWGEDEFGGVELSGLGGEPDQQDVVETRLWAEVGTDLMHAVPKRLAVGGAQNRPQVAGEPANSHAYIRELEAGFVGAYEIFERHRDTLLAPPGPLHRFAPDRVRFLARPTRTYQIVLDKSYHPDYLRDSADRELLFERLWRPRPVRSTGPDRSSELFESELDDLRDDCIPLFWTTADSRDLRDGRERVFRDYFPRSALEVAVDRLRRLGSEDRERQLWMIRAAFAKVMREGTAISTPSRTAVTASAPSATPTPLDAATAIARRLVVLSAAGNGRRGWFTLMPTDRREGRAIKVAGLDLQRGLPGILVFLACLAASTQSAEVSRIAGEALLALRDIIAQYEAVGAEARNADWPGASRGWGGVVIGLATAGNLLDDPTALEEAVQIARRLEPLIAADHHLDVDRGSAGALLALLHLGSHCDERWLHDLQLRCGRRLVSALRTTRRGPTRDLYPPAREPRGFGDGVSGIAYALILLGVHRRRKEYIEVGTTALRSELARVLLREQAWPRSGLSIYPEGLGLSVALAALPEEHLRPERARLRELLAADGLRCADAENDSLFGGLAGAVTLTTALANADRSLAGTARGLLHRLVRRTVDGRLRCDEVAGTEVPGLGTGLAGVGYALLHSSRPEGMAMLPTLLPHPNSTALSLRELGARPEAT
jgi:type 2 lantibiotic biosynthesis protein LanM